MAPRKLPAGILHLLAGVRCCIQNTRCIGPIFLVSPFYLSVPPRATFDVIIALFLRYAHTLFRGFWEMDGLYGCVCCLVVNTLLSRVSCPFQWLRKSNGGTGPAIEACALTTRSVTWFGLGFSPDFKRGRRTSWRVRGWGIISFLFLLCS